MKKFKRNQVLTQLTWLFIALTFFSTTAQASASVSEAEVEPIPKKVLFVGNSYTYYWNLPQLVSYLSTELGTPLIARQSTEGGVNLEQHWKSEKGLKTRQLIEQGDWDYVVFNNHSLSTIERSEQFFDYGKKFADLVKQHGGEPVFYMTWAREYNKLMLDTIAGSYRRLAQQADAHVVPVGELWLRSVTLHPEYAIYATDGSHPSPTGAYVTALAFAKFFSGASVMDAPHRIQVTDKDDEKFYLAILQDNEADFFKRLVDTYEFTVMAQETEKQ